MSRSPRRRKDKQWCHGCDRARAPRDGYGRCRHCLDRLTRFKLRRVTP